MTRQDLVGNIKAIAESALLFAESRAAARPDCEHVLHMQPAGTARPKIQLRDAATTIWPR
jgi:hypothetical protein